MNYEQIDTIAGQRGLKSSLEQLFVECYPKPLAEDIWQNLYLASPWGWATSITAWDDDGLAGHYAWTPFPIVNAKGERGLIARGMTLAIAPRARTLGVLGELLSRTKAALRAQGIAGIVGFPNELSWRPLTLFHGWQVLHESAMTTITVPEVSAAIMVTPEIPFRPAGWWPPIDDAAFMGWRGTRHRFEHWCVNDELMVVGKRLEPDTLDVMDLWGRSTEGLGDRLFALARRIGAAKVIMTDHHARSIGLEPGEPTGYVVRQAVMPVTPERLPDLRFSLLFSDVFH